MPMQKLFEEAKRYIPGGVNSPVRAFGAVGGTPIFFEKASGPYLWDANGKKYIDYVGSWGPAILGHADPKVVAAVKNAAERGFSFGAPTELETRLAMMICAAVPSVEKIRFVSSGTEATMSAIRLARGFTGRDKILKFDGCYHGHADSLLVAAGSGAATFGMPNSKGVPADFAKHTFVVPYNDLPALKKIFETHGKEIAAVIVEPIAGNMGVVLPKPEFLPGIRSLCDQYGSLFICDEVMTGFRVAFGGAQSLYNIRPDITCFGKVIGGGLPVGAFGGRADIMDQLAPTGPVYQAGTLSGNPLAMTAGIKTLEQLSVPGVYERLAKQTTQLTEGLKEIFQKKKIVVDVVSTCGMFTVFFNEGKEVFSRFFHKALEGGIYWPPSAFEAAFVSLTHDDAVVSETLRVIYERR